MKNKYKAPCGKLIEKDRKRFIEVSPKDWCLFNCRTDLRNCPAWDNSKKLKKYLKKYEKRKLKDMKK